MSTEPAQETIYPPMSKPKARSTLYRLIEAGQLARRALLVPLLDRGLEPGDDAVIFALHTRLGATETALAEELELDPEALGTRLARLADRDVITRRAVGPDLVAGLALTERGERICEVLSANWDQLEAALFDELDDKQRKKLDKVLRRFVELLRL
jgi:DNA-binding MarR family transcriptional regulator